MKMVGFERDNSTPYGEAIFSKWHIDMKISIPFRNIFVSIKIDRRDDLMVETLQHYTREDVNERNNGYNKKRQKTASTKSVISNPLLLHD